MDNIVNKNIHDYYKLSFNDVYFPFYKYITLMKIF